MLPGVLRSLFAFSDLLFAGLKIILPIAFILKLMGPKWLKSLQDTFVQSLNILMLGAGSLFCMAFVTDMITCNPFERELRMELMAGSNGYRMMLPVIGYAILPQLLWLRNLRSTFTTSMLIVIYWLTTYLLVHFSIKGLQFNFIWNIDWIEVLIEAVITLVIGILIYKVYQPMGSKKSRSV